MKVKRSATEVVLRFFCLYRKVLIISFQLKLALKRNKATPSQENGRRKRTIQKNGKMASTQSQ